MSSGRRFDLVAFDMDGVLVEYNSTWCWIHNHFGVSNDTALQEFIDGDIDDHEFMRRDIALWKERIPDINIDYINDVLDPVPEVKGVGETVQALRTEGIKTIIVSGGLDIVAQRIADSYGFDGWAANGLEVDDLGALTGKGILRVELVNKRKALDSFLEKWGISSDRTAAVGNSFVDVSMFKGCSFSIAYNPIDAWVAENANAVVNSDDLSDILPLLLD
ncbi:MAG: HAD-IB family phosphatase [Methanomassiliicoccales archaeon]|nr:HAD-IB family phosphatase [Methanomassiliicoccales archaeon]NYT16363.1 HAD-IB family phosphatase [Methanomassiliicoccales archaeon]